MVKGPGLAGSPETTAILDPLGSPSGPSIHFKPFACAGDAAMIAVSVIRNRRFIITLLYSAPRRNGRSTGCRFGTLGLMAPPSPIREPCGRAFRRSLGPLNLNRTRASGAL